MKLRKTRIHDFSLGAVAMVGLIALSILAGNLINKVQVSSRAAQINEIAEQLQAVKKECGMQNERMGF